MSSGPSRPFEARFPEACSSCDGMIKIGQWAVYLNDEIAHEVCPPPPVSSPPCPRCFQVPAANGTCGCDG